ncbi:MAG TPA: M14 family zinc carboxypeptidase [Trebonia sp.]|jgi:hypothetical protein
MPEMSDDASRLLDTVLLESVRRTTGAYVSFPSVSQVQSALAGLTETAPKVRVSLIGNSRLRDPLRMVTIGDGPQHILVIAGSHPNEPVGFHTILVLARLIADVPELAAGRTWHFLPGWDPDGARLNQWFAGPLRPDRYYRGFYRPVAHEQPGFAFPLGSAHPPGNEPAAFERPLPETWAVMHVIDRVRPDLVIDLHNGELDAGAWFVVNRRQEGLAGLLRRAVTERGLKVVDATSEYVGWEADGPGVFLEPKTSPYGETSTQYGATLSQYLTPAVLVVTPEVSLWDTIAPPVTGGLDEALAAVAGELDASAGILIDCLAAAAPDLRVRTPFEPAAIMPIDQCQRLAARARDWPGEPTGDDYAGELRTLHSFRLRATGLLLRTLAAEIAAGNQTPVIRSVAARLEAQFSDWLASFEATLAPRAVPVGDLVHAQAGAALAAAAHLRRDLRQVVVEDDVVGVQSRALLVRGGFHAPGDDGHAPAPRRLHDPGRQRGQLVGDEVRARHDVGGQVAPGQPLQERLILQETGDLAHRIRRLRGLELVHDERVERREGVVPAGVLQRGQDGDREPARVVAGRALDLDLQRDPAAHAVDHLGECRHPLRGAEEPGLRQVRRRQFPGGPGQARRTLEVEVMQHDQLAAAGELHVKLAGVAFLGRRLERGQGVLRPPGGQVMQAPVGNGNRNQPRWPRPRSHEDMMTDEAAGTRVRRKYGIPRG